MPAQQNFFSAKLSSDKWLFTVFTPNTAQYILGARGVGNFLDKADADAQYPGFSAAYDMLARIHCDRYEVTIVLKVCIEHAGGQDLATFLVESITLKTIETALAIGLTGEELEAALVQNTTEDVSSQLPDDVTFGSGS